MKLTKTAATLTAAALYLAFCLSTVSAAEPHFYYSIPVRAAVVQSVNVPGAAAARDVLMLNIRLLDPNPFRLRVFYTVRTPDGKEVTWEREVRVKPGELWATVAFDEEGVLRLPGVRVRIKEEPEPVALVESVADAGR